jgi:sugar O-acyltransferase (sialic acid O-acetyltransferase NeuD family)
MRFVLYGVSTPFASELLETARRAELEVVPVRNVDAPVPPEILAPLDADALDEGQLALSFAVPQTLPVNRYRAFADARRHGLQDALTLVDPTASVASTAVLGNGVYVGTGSVLAAGVRLADCVLVNRSCSIGHHSRLDEYVCTGPGVVVAGSCRIERGAFLGAGAILCPALTVGAGAIVGAGSVVVSDVAPGQVVVGNPARVLKPVDLSLKLPGN